MRKIAAAACVASICSASSVFAMDLVTKGQQGNEMKKCIAKRAVSARD